MTRLALPSPNGPRFAPALSYRGMATPSSTPPAGGLTDLSKFIYGTTRLGDDKIPFADRVMMAHAAMDAGVWFHTSHQYGDALKVLRAAFDADRKRIPRMIFKIGWSSIEELRQTIRVNIQPLGVDHMDIGQLCLGGKLAGEFASGGKCYDDFRTLRDEGLVHRFVMEVFPWTSGVPLEALRAGYPNGVVDGYIFYLNPLQRFASNELWDLLQERGEPIVAMRTVAGGDVHRLRDVPGAAWKDYLRQRAVEVARCTNDRSARPGPNSACDLPSDSRRCVPRSPHQPAGKPVCVSRRDQDRPTPAEGHSVTNHRAAIALVRRDRRACRAVVNVVNPWPVPRRSPKTRKRAVRSRKASGSEANYRHAETCQTTPVPPAILAGVSVIHPCFRDDKSFASVLSRRP